MLQTFLLWFYCLPIIKAATLILFLTALYQLLRRRWNGSRFWLPVVICLLFLFLWIIFAATLTDRIPGTVITEPEFQPFYSWFAAAAGETELPRESFMNIALFYPAGLLAYGLLPERWKWRKKAILVTLFFAGLSAGIEYCQYRFALGQAEVDDVIHNALGAFIGAVLSRFDFCRNGS